MNYSPMWKVLFFIWLLLPLSLPITAVVGLVYWKYKKLIAKNKTVS